MHYIPLHGCDGVDQDVAMDTNCVALRENEVFILVCACEEGRCVCVCVCV